MTVQNSLQLFKALSDECRLRILRVVSMAELSVAELVKILGLPQSTVSRHLKPLRDAGLVETRRNGTSVFYHRGPALAEPDLSTLLERHLTGLPGEQEDRTTVRLLLDQRRAHSRDFFDEIAGRYGSLTEPGGGWSALASALACGFRGKTVADLGCGEGALALQLAPFVREVIAVDLAPRMLAQVVARAEKAGYAGQIKTVEGELENLPLPDASVDAVFLSQSLHHASDPKQALQEAVRILRSGGELILLDLMAHEQDWVREQYADLWLGFDAQELLGHLEALGIDEARVQHLPGATPELPVFLMTGTKSTS